MSPYFVLSQETGWQNRINRRNGIWN